MFTLIFRGMKLRNTLSASPESVRITADLINRYPDRFLFGTDEVAPSNQEKYLRVYYEYEPLWNALSPQASEACQERQLRTAL